MRQQEQQDPFDALMRAVAVQESQSTGDTRARNSRTNAYGRYQILPRNWPSWSRAALGDGEHEQTPENQEAVARHRMRQYVERFGMEGALVAWYGGEGRGAQWVKNPDNPWFDRRHGDIDPRTGERTEPSVREYVNSIMSRITPQEAPQAAPAQPQARVNADPFPISNPMSTENFAPRSSPAAAAPTAQPQARVNADPFPISNPMSTENFAQVPQGGGLPSEADVLSFLNSPQEPQGLPTEADVLSFLGSEQPQAPAAPPSPRDRGRQSAEGIGFIGAAGQGAGSGFFGAGTPVTAAEAMIVSRLRGEPMEWADALEYARGRQEGAYEERPGAYRTGFAGSMVGGITGGARLATKLPGAVRTAFTPTKAAEGASRGARAANTGANIARFGVVGGAAAGVTALNQEGAAAVPGAAIGGAITGPLAVGGLNRVARIPGWVRGRMGDNPALSAIGDRIRMTGDAVDHGIRRAKEAFPGRRVPVAEVLDDRSAEGLSMLAHTSVGARAGTVFREAGEAASEARPRELQREILRGGPTTTVPGEQRALAPIQDEAGSMFGPGENIASRRFQTTEQAQLRFRNQSMDKAMGEPGTGQGFGDHQVHLTREMLESVMHPDVQEAIPAILRRRIIKTLEENGDIGSVALSVRTWDAVRQALANKSGPGAGQEYTRLRNMVRDYVSERVPEYGVALREFGRRSEGAAAATVGRRALTEDTRVFRELLTDMTPEQRLTARGGARAALAQRFRDPERATRTMEQLSRDDGFRANLRNLLDPAEWRQLEDLADAYGHQLRRVEGATVGARGISTPGTEARFAAEAGRAPIAQPPRRVGNMAHPVEPHVADVIEEVFQPVLGPTHLLELSEPVVRAMQGGNTRAIGRAMDDFADNLHDAMRQLGVDDVDDVDQMVRGLSQDVDAYIRRRGSAPSSAAPLQRGTGVRATQEGGEALAQASRGALASSAVENPQWAAAVAEAMSEHPGFVERIGTALGGREQGRLQGIGDVATRARINYETLTPLTTEAQSLAAQQAREIQTAIGTFVILGTGQSSAAMKASTFATWAQRLRLTPNTAERAAQLLVDPEQADKIIAYLRARGATANEIHSAYQSAAAAAAGILRGAGAQGTGEERAEERGSLAPPVELELRYPNGGGR